MSILLEHLSTFDLFIKIIGPIGTILGAVIGVYLRHYLKKKRERKEAEAQDPVINDINRCEEINSYIDNILNDVGADRMVIYQFHNGDHYYTGHDIQKMSAVFESRSSGTSQERVNNQNLLVSYYNKFLKELIHYGSYFRRDVSKVNDAALRDHLLSQGVKSFLSFPVYSINHKLVAFVTVEYVKAMKNNIDSDKDVIKEVTHKLSGYLSESKSE